MKLAQGHNLPPLPYTYETIAEYARYRIERDAIDKGDDLKGHIDLNVVVFHVGILVTIEQVRAELGLAPVKRAYRSQVVKHFTGSGKGKRDELKRRCLVQCQATGWNVLDENTADALAVLDWFCYEQDQATPWDCSPRTGGLFTPKGAAPPVNKVEDQAVNRLAQDAMRFMETRGTTF